MLRSAEEHLSDTNAEHAELRSTGVVEADRLERESKTLPNQLATFTAHHMFIRLQRIDEPASLRNVSIHGPAIVGSYDNI